MKEIFDKLKELKIQYQEYKHPALFTCEDALEYWNPIEGLQVKNLFLRNKKGTHYFLAVVPDNKKVDLKKFSEFLGKGRLSFGSPERLKKHLNVTPGSVSILGLIYDHEKEVEVILDNEISECSKILFHPNDNKKTLSIKKKDLFLFLESLGYSINYFTF